ncbi:Hypothetical protein NTJ_09430 [Nesidiocoris tenuis]|uniref:Odorant receptor n=1 Tax=Nesidiocoris tenuis TaxID=355587 RepID=A0ABN7AX77_9HEMI|nr:Hypothetical protein NTJ_09430 [Nesidiocoris tenuis]
MAGTGRIVDNEMVEGLDVWYLRRTALWEMLNVYRETGKKNYVWWLYFFITYGFCFPIILSSLLGPFFVEKDLEGMTLTLLNPLTTVQMVVKFQLCLWTGLESQSKLLNLMKKDFLTCIPPEKKARAEEILRESGREATFVANIALFINGLTVSTLNIIPILRSEFFHESLGIKFFGKPSGHNKILGFWWPGDLDETPESQLIYIYEFGICSYVGLFITLIEALIAQNIIMLTAHLKVLIFLIREIKSTESCESELLT